MQLAKSRFHPSFPGINQRVAAALRLGLRARHVGLTRHEIAKAIRGMLYQ